LFTVGNYQPLEHLSFLRLNIAEEKLPDNLASQTILMLSTSSDYAMQHLRRFVDNLTRTQINNPVVLQRSYGQISEEELQLFAATDLGGMLVDGFGDGVMLKSGSVAQSNATAFGTLQAARTRMTKTEYISCPSCGRTLFDLQDTTAMIRARTDHLKGVKIGIMGCIVNGPGEMADADYGYVGSGPGKITLYKGQEVVKKGLPTEGAVDELIELIKSHGDWVEPEINQTIS
jgi:(E)-4-hydroxy-3-methylbut-2-enyl-diphosphate synthase